MFNLKLKLIFSLTASKPRYPGQKPRQVCKAIVPNCQFTPCGNVDPKFLVPVKHAACLPNFTLYKKGKLGCCQYKVAAEIPAPNKANGPKETIAAYNRLFKDMLSNKDAVNPEDLVKKSKDFQKDLKTFA